MKRGHSSLVGLQTVVLDDTGCVTYYNFLYGLQDL